jgi:hypothetical protein
MIGFFDMRSFPALAILDVDRDGPTPFAGRWYDRDHRRKQAWKTELR